MSTRRIAAVMNVTEPTAFDAELGGADETFTVYRGHRTVIPCRILDLGGPPILEAEIVNADVEIFQDTGRNNRLGSDDENAYIFEITNVDLDALTFDLIFDLTAMSTPITATTYYIDLVVEQG